ANDWNFAGIWSGATGASYSAALNYLSGGGTTANTVLTGSPDFSPRAVINGDPGSGCSSNPNRQFNTAAFQGPLAGSVGLDSGRGYRRGCFISPTDLSISRVTRLHKEQRIQLRLDLFNAFNQAGITAVNSTMNLASTAAGAATAIANLPYDAGGNLIPS